MIRSALVAVLLTWLLGCAHADRAQIADGVTQAVKQTPTEICEPGLLGLTVSGYSLALWNIGVMAGSGPAAIPVALALALWQWDSWAVDARDTCSPGIVGSNIAYEVLDEEYELLVYRGGHP